MNFVRVLEQLKRHEGYRARPYTDTVGVLTIGYGRNLTGMGLTRGEAEYLLRNDITRAILHLEGKYDWFASQPDGVQEALINMCVNLGPDRLAGFTKMLAAFDHGDLREARAQMLDSKWATQVGQRAIELADQVWKEPNDGT